MRKMVQHFPQKVCWIMLLILTLSGASISAAQTETPDTASYDADVARAWMALIYDLVRAEGINVPAAARIYGYSGVTLYLAVARGMGTDTLPLIAQLNGLPTLPPLEEGAAYDPPAIANGALSVVTERLFFPPDQAAFVASGQGIATRNTINNFTQQQQRIRYQQISSEVVDRSFAYGQALGDALIPWIASDNYDATREMTEFYELPEVLPDDAWVITTPGQDPMEPYWGSIRTFLLPDADACAVPLDVPFDTDLDSTFHQQAMEVRDMGQVLTEEQQEIARFWNEVPGETGTASGHWLSVVGQLSDYLDLNLQQSATAYALVTITMYDAFISSWSLKYQVNLLRPETYIQRYVDPTWQPYRQSPPFPAYPSGHAVLGGAVATVLTEHFGPLAYTDRYGVQYGLRARSYTSFHAAAYENAISRLYGGVHWRVDMENGLEQGECVGQIVIGALLG